MIEKVIAIDSTDLSTLLVQLRRTGRTHGRLEGGVGRARRRRRQRRVLSRRGRRLFEDRHLHCRRQEWLQRSRHEDEALHARGSIRCREGFQAVPLLQEAKRTLDLFVFNKYKQHLIFTPSL